MKRRKRHVRHCSLCGATGHDARNCPKRRGNPFLEEIIIKPMATAAMAHVGQEAAKATIKRARKARAKRKRR